MSQRVPMWMAPHAKFVACYERPFWLTATAAAAAPLRVHALYQPAVVPADWRGHFWMAGSESARQHGGFLEGALVAAEAVVAQILERPDTARACRAGN